MRLSDMTSPEVSGGSFVLAIGSFEQHGPHLPLATDTLIVEAVAVKVADELGAVVGPTIPVGVSAEHMGFPGTLTLEHETLKALVTDLVSSLRRHGFDEIIIINGHGGNNRALAELNVDVRLVNLTGLLERYDHAGEVETSLIMHLHPELVKTDEIRRHDFKWPGSKEWADTREYSVSGVLGNPTKASAEKGKELYNTLVGKALDMIRG